MRQLKQIVPSNVSAPFLHPNRWQAFVKIVLEITIEAYQKMRQDHIAQGGWEEDTFTINLVDYIRSIASSYPMSLIVKPQTWVFTDEMKKGAISPRNASRIDIQLWGGHWDNYEQIYFAWECKLVIDKPIYKKHNRLIPEYIREGIYRFLDGKYSSYVKDAGMLGYILAGDAKNIVKEINDKMLVPRKPRKSNSSTALSANNKSSSSHKLNESDHLRAYNPTNEFNDIYISQHNRNFCADPIQLYHLFLTFDF